MHRINWKPAANYTTSQEALKHPAISTGSKIPQTAENVTLEMKRMDW